MWLRSVCVGIDSSTTKQISRDRGPDYGHHFHHDEVSERVLQAPLAADGRGHCKLITFCLSLHVPLPLTSTMNTMPNSTIFTATAAWLLRPHGYHRGKKPVRTVDLDLELAKLQASIADWLERHKEPVSSHVPLLRWQVADLVTTVGACVLEDRKFEYPALPDDSTSAPKKNAGSTFEVTEEGTICRKVHESSVCCICLEHISYYDSDVAVLARCGHAFHFVWWVPTCWGVGPGAGAQTEQGWRFTGHRRTTTRLILGTPLHAVDWK